MLLKLANGRMASLARSDIAAAIYGAMHGRVETMFGDSIAAIDDGGTRVRVGFEQAPPREFDLVIGAEGEPQALAVVGTADGIAQIEAWAARVGAMAPVRWSTLQETATAWLAAGGLPSRVNP